MIGLVFERLTVIGTSDKRSKSRGVFWKCVCVCGKKLEVLSSSLRSGHTKSCGCLQKEVVAAANTARLKGKKGKESIGWKGGRTTSGNGYVLVYAPNHPRNNKGYISEHRLLMESRIGRKLNDSEVVHHVNGIKDDNRIENLMIFASTADHTAYHHATGMR